ncbi:hypothetical protein EVAR_12894_1 [Eumeta japonica]|uniref:Uncharacterized protein n=1 Tax=Eumeta variegata TaxID=151549 RepID=A0A4C1TVP9_EUMVA|nr:hypothetical protein EVAR_12894_1 [Eumeta japonica]
MSTRATKKLVITAAHEHSQPQRNQQYIDGLLVRNRICDEGEIDGERVGNGGGRDGMEEGRGPPELSLIRRKETTEAANSRLYFVKVRFQTGRTGSCRSQVDYSMALL